MKPDRIAALDGLRGVAILAVVAFHARLLPGGWMAVEVFFALSGFLVTSLLVHAKDRPLREYLTGFYWRRALRILPLAWFLVVIVALVTHEWRGALWYASFFQNWLPLQPEPRALGPYWYLAVEGQFYLLWPFAVFFLNRKQLIGLCLAVPLLDTAFRFYLGIAQPWYALGHFIGNATPTRADALAIGALLAVWRPKRSPISGVLASILFVVVLIGTGGVLEYALKPAVLALGAGCLVLLIYDTRPTWLERPWLTRLGVLSYGVYLIHGVLSPWFVREIGTVHVRAALLLGVSVLLAEASWRFIESPCLAMQARSPLAPPSPSHRSAPQTHPRP